MKKIKKCISILLVFLLLPCVCAAAEEELIRNGGFEDTSTVKDDWGYEPNTPFYLKNSTETVVSTCTITDEMADSNGGSGYAFKITNTEKNLNVWAKQKLLTTKDGIIPGATYRLSYRIHAEGLGDRNDAGVGCYLAYYSENSESEKYYLSGTEIKYFDSSTNGQWTVLSDTFVFPANAKMLRILLRSYAIGTVYFDDISLEMVEAEKFAYSTSHVFHYTTEDYGTAKVSILPYFQEGIYQLDTKKLYVNFGIYNDKTRLTGQNNVSFSNFEASYTYPVSVLKTLGKEYTLKITVLDTTNTALDSFEQSLYIYERPRFLDEDGNFRDKWGKIVSPVNAWHLKQGDFDEARQAGFTTFTMVYDCRRPEREEITEAYITAAENAGLIGLFTLYDEAMNAAAHPTNIENTIAIVNKYKDDRRFLGWVVQDEPLGGGITEEKKELLELSYKTIRDIDPNHPVILTDYRRDVFKETVKYCDIFIPNSYGRGYEGVRTYVEEATKYAQGRPVYPNICAYSGDKTLAGLPTGEQVQHFIHQAFLAGAKGVSVYAFSDPVTEPYRVPLYQTPIWEPLVDTGNTELPTLFDLFVYGKETPECTETSMYIQRKWARQDGDYYFLMSVSDADQTLEYTVGEEKAVRLLGGDSANLLSLSDGTLSVSLRGGDVLMFRVFNKADAIRVEKNGLGIKKTETGTFSISAPSGTQRLLACLYKTVNNTAVLLRLEIAAGSTMSFTVDASEAAYSLRVYAWDTALQPVTMSLQIGGC